MNDASKLEAALSFLDKLANGNMSWFAFEQHPDGSGSLQTDSNVSLNVAEVELLTSVSKTPPTAAPGPGGLPVDWDDEDDF